MIQSSGLVTVYQSETSSYSFLLNIFHFIIFSPLHHLVFKTPASLSCLLHWSLTQVFFIFPLIVMTAQLVCHTVHTGAFYFLKIKIHNLIPLLKTFQCFLSEVNFFKELQDQALVLSTLSDYNFKQRCFLSALCLYKSCFFSFFKADCSQFQLTIASHPSDLNSHITFSKKPILQETSL